MKEKDTKRPKDIDDKIKAALDQAYSTAEAYVTSNRLKRCKEAKARKSNADKLVVPAFVKESLESKFVEALEQVAKLCEKASTGYLNIITSLAIKAALGETVDIRYHQVQIQDQTNRPTGFNFRGVSEKVVYHWMESHEFHGAKSGWQTRTFERPKPYLLTYDENIGAIKKPFLTTYDEVEEHNQDASIALAFLMLRRIELREKEEVILAIPKIQDIQQITNLFERHFFYSYKDSKGGSRLPVLALHSIYSLLIKELSRYKGKTLKQLEPHSAADSQTGSIGDIEVVNNDGNVFEAVEVKHMIPISREIIDTAKQKIRGSQVDRYYILTTSPNHEPTEEVRNEIENVNKLLGCQMIANGVIPTIKYYLRLLSNPSQVLPLYVKELESDTAISFEHKDVWNKIATGEIDKL